MQIQADTQHINHGKEVLGKCPLCGTGNIIIHHGNFVCTNHFINAEGHPRCTFSLPYDFRGGHITKEIVKQLIEKGETDFLKMSSHKGSPYKCKLKAVPGKGLVPIYDKFRLGIHCPICGGGIVSTNRSFCCENYLKNPSTCHFSVPHIMCKRIIRYHELAAMLNGGTDVIDGFRSTTGISFSGFLDMDSEYRAFVNCKVGKCPSCGGDVLVGPGAFNCSNYKNGCNFKVAREYDGHLLTVEEGRKLLTDGKLVITGSDTFGNIIYDRLTISHDMGKHTITKNRFVTCSED